MLEKIFCLMGPTASGKTDLACEIALNFPVEIISVDSAMIYREMNIGTAKPSSEQLQQTPHHLIDIINPNESYSVAQFCAEAKNLCVQIKKRNKIPLLVGGTMMYFRALQTGLSTLPSANKQLREKLTREGEERGWEYMHQWLLKLDPQRAKTIHPNDTQRIQRALEIYLLTKQPMSGFLPKKTTTNDSLLSSQYINIQVIPDNRAWLHQRIEQRFAQMLNIGLIDEVKLLLNKWSLSADMPSLRCVGYRQVYDYLQGNFDLKYLLEKGTAATRQLAKRQLTWLRHWPNGNEFIAEDPLLYQKVKKFFGENL